jgi:hypothetical protein
MALSGLVEMHPDAPGIAGPIWPPAITLLDFFEVAHALLQA